MVALIWLAGGILVAAMLVIEILEGHAAELALVGVGLVALACRMQTGPARPLLRLACAIVAVAAVLSAGCTHWFDGRIDLSDLVYAAGALLAALLAFAPRAAATDTAEVEIEPTPPPHSADPGNPG